MRFLLRHPVMNGLGIEILLSVLGVCFSMPGHKWPAVALAIDYVHSPAAALLGRVDGLLGLHIPPVPFYWLCSGLMVPVWIVLIFIAGRFVSPAYRVDSREHDAEQLPVSHNSSDWRRS